MSLAGTLGQGAGRRDIVTIGPMFRISVPRARLNKTVPGPAVASNWPLALPPSDTEKLLIVAVMGKSFSVESDPDPPPWWSR